MISPAKFANLIIKESGEYSTLSKLYDALLEPDFEEKNRIHNWKNYIPSQFKKVWPELTIEIKLSFYIMAELQASAEDWD